MKSCAHWLNWKCGIALGAAREKLRTAHALAGLPRIAEAMAEGRLSFSKVRAMTRVAESSNEDYFLSIGLNGTASQVEKLVRSFRRAKESQELSREAAQQRNQSLWWFYEPDGSLTINGRLPAEIGALFLKALQAAEDSIPRKDVSAGTFSDTCLTTGARRVAALSSITESFLATGAQELAGGDRHQIVVHVDVETLKHDAAGRCELEEGPGLAAETARRLACDASLISIVENEKGEPLNVGRKTRTTSIWRLTGCCVTASA
ncbi:MAG: 13E12 repeat family protein [Pseudomonadota bacterium]|nr:13E12 repeat family protein [Pseudomonadota bacterium]